MIRLYAVWASDVIIKFSEGEIRANNDMNPIVAEMGDVVVLPSNTMVSSTRVPKFTFHESPSGIWDNDIGFLNSV
jgi:hypothetical protein